MNSATSTFEITQISEEDLCKAVPHYAGQENTCLRSINFKLNKIDEHNSQEAGPKIRKLFRIFAEECKNTLSRRNDRRREIQYQSFKGFLNCNMPDGSRILTIILFPLDGAEGLYLVFAWYGREEMSYE